VTNKFLINRRDARIMGVAAGISDYSGVDPTIIRVALVAALLLTGPIVLILYLVTRTGGRRALRPGAASAAAAAPLPNLKSLIAIIPTR
jgi:phage shock protein C